MASEPEKYAVECHGPHGKSYQPGLAYDRAVERCEAERAKGWWSTVKVRNEATGVVVASYLGSAPAGQLS